MQLYDRLLEAYGAQHWWPAESPFEVIVGAVLTQNTSWTNAATAIANLKGAGALSARRLREMPHEELASMLRPAGYFNSKARKLRAVSEYMGRYGDDLDALFRSKPLPELREEVLSVYGVGPETADSILLYAGGLPTFVVDAYTKRILGRLEVLSDDVEYETVRDFFHRALPPDPQLFNEFHALLVTHARDSCRKRAPRCFGCPLLDLCPAGRQEAPGAGSGRRNGLLRRLHSPA